MRHGETDWNKRLIIQGQKEIPLNEDGILEAKKAHDELLLVPLDVIICSPIGRVVETANIVNEGRNIPIITDNRIKEEFYGSWEGAPRHGDAYLKQRQKFATRYPGGENYLDVAARVYPFLDEVKAKYRNKNVLVIAHGGISRVVNSYFYDMSNDEFFNYVIGNCEIKKYEFSR
jgi:probable phosphoglycerate mutase